MIWTDAPEVMEVLPMTRLAEERPILPVHSTPPLEFLTQKNPAVPVATAVTAAVLFRAADPAEAAANAVLPNAIVAKTVPVMLEFPVAGCAPVLISIVPELTRAVIALTAAFALRSDNCVLSAIKFTV